MYRRKEYSQLEQTFMENVQEEYTMFKRNMLLKTPMEIYENCHLIYFYKCVYEYMQYNDNISKQFINYVYNKKDIIELLKTIYMKYEYLQFATWDSIDDIISCYIHDNVR